MGKNIVFSWEIWTNDLLLNHIDNLQVLVQQLRFSHPFGIAKPFGKPPADEAQQDIPSNHHFPESDLPPGKQLTP